MRSPWSRLATGLTSRSALSLPTWAVGMAPSFTTAVLHDRNLYGGSAWGWALAAAIGALAAGGVLVVAAVIARGRRSLAWVLASFACAGAVRGLGVGMAATALGLAPEGELAGRAASGAVLVAFWLSSATLIVDGWRAHAQRDRTLATELASARAMRGAAREELARIRARTRAEVVAPIGVIRARLLALAADPDAAADAALRIASELEGATDTAVRPLSHELGEDGSVDAAADEPAAPSASVAMRARAFLVDIVTVSPFRGDWLAFVLFPSILITAVRAYGPVVGVLGALAISLLAAAPLALAGRFLPVMRRLPVAARAIAVLLTWGVAAAASTLPVAAGVAWGIGPDYAWAVFGVPLLAYVPIGAATLAIIFAVDRGWTMSEEEQQAELDQVRWAAKRVEQEAWVTRHRLSRALHGPVQSALTASAIRLQRAAQTRDPEAIRAACGTEAATLAIVGPGLLDGAAAGDIGDIAPVLGQIAELWTRVASVRLELQDEARSLLGRDPQAAEHVVEIVREGIANAIRHGRAATVAVGISSLRPGVIAVSIDDDGTSASLPTAGLGTRLIDRAATGVVREPSPLGGLRLRCDVPTRADAPDAPGEGP